MIITNANALLGEAFAPHTTLRTSQGKITAIEADSPAVGTGANASLNLEGDYLLPGFVDVHIHAFMGHDTMEGEEAVRHMSRELRKVGVAAFLPTTMSASPEATQKALAGIQAVMENPEPGGAVVLGAHMEAPFLQPTKAGAQLKEFFVLPTLENWNEYVGPYESAVRMITLAPELQGAMEFIQTLTQKGIVVSIGHTDCSAEHVHEAADHGASHITHTFNAQTPLAHRAPGVPGAALVDSRIACEFICDGIHLHPDIVRLIAQAKGPTLAVAVTDAMEAAGMPDGTYQLGGQDVFVKDGAARLKDGTLAGSTLTMMRALQNLIAFGVAPQDAARMVTEAPALSIKEPDFGRLRVDAPAVMVRFDKEWGFQGVIEE